MQLLCKQLQTEFIYNCNNELFCSIFPKLKCKYVQCRAQMCLFPFSVINLRGFGFFHNIAVCPISSLCNLSELCFAIKASQVIFLWKHAMVLSSHEDEDVFICVLHQGSAVFEPHISSEYLFWYVCTKKNKHCVQIIHFFPFTFFLLFFLIWCTGKSFCSQGGTVCRNAIISFLLSISHKVVFNKIMQNATFFCHMCAFF